VDEFYGGLREEQVHYEKRVFPHLGLKDSGRTDLRGESSGRGLGECLKLLMLR